ncbi:MAG: hypothetical protein AAGK02_13085, partial [Pseudomonadota bacterium]
MRTATEDVGLGSIRGAEDVKDGFGQIEQRLFASGSRMPARAPVATPAAFRCSGETSDAKRALENEVEGSL